MSTISDATSTSINSNNLWMLNCIYGTNSASTTSTDSSSSDSSSSDSISISDGLSTLASFISTSENLTDDQKKELKGIMEKAQSEMGKDGYSTEDLADSASDDLKSALKDQGVDLKNVLDSYDALYSASKSTSGSSDYSSLLTSSGSSKLYSSITTLINREFESV